MKILPFHTAPAETVDWSPPRLACHREVIEPGQTFQTWDYLSEISVSLDFRIDAVGLAQAVLGPERGVHGHQEWLLAQTLVMLQVECPATQYRQFVDCQVPHGHRPGALSLTIPAGVVASEIVLTAAVVLRYPIPGAGPLVPDQAGSRLLVDQPRWSVTLEGKGSSFPLSAFDFEDTGYPETALWFLEMQPGRLEDPFASVVRLLVNTGHPRSADLLGGGDDGRDLHEVLHYDVLATMLEAVAGLPECDLRVDFEEGSLGYVLGELTGLYLGLDLGDAAGQVASDLPAFKAELQRAVRFLGNRDEEE